MRQIINKALGLFNLRLTKKSTFDNLIRENKSAEDIEFLMALDPDSRSQVVDYLRSYTSQIRQDLFVLSKLNFKRNGYFVEFGATDGVELSNTCLLEKEFNWTGILAEPAKTWHSQLRKNRKAHIETKCVWKKSGEKLLFNQTEAGIFSTIDDFSSNDLHKGSRVGGKKYQVETISLIDLLDKFQAPKVIDYLSLDTEGSEFEILESFDFSQYQIKVITCEHNYTPQRERIYDLLTKNGFTRQLESLSKYDDWYVSNSSTQ